MQLRNNSPAPRGPKTVLLQGRKPEVLMLPLSCLCVGSLQVLCMSEEEFKEYKEQDGWEDDSEEEENSTLSNAALSRLKAPCKALLYDSVLLTLESYRSDLRAEQDLLSKQVYEKLSRREQQALHVRYGQKRILHQLLELVQ